MEKIKQIFNQIKIYVESNLKKIKNLFIHKKTVLTSKKDLDFKNVSIVFFCIVGIFLILGMLMPSEDNRVFRQVAKDPMPKPIEVKNDDDQKSVNSASKIWGHGSSSFTNNQNGVTHVNYNTAMVIGSKNGNSRTELHAGTQMRLQILEKFIASQDGTPVIAKLIDEVTSDSGNTIPAGALFYGEATYQQSSGRATVKFNKVSYPNGTVRDVSANVLGSDGLSGLDGNVRSDAVKNSVGQVITTFVSGLAAGSVERDLIGNSKGGISNGILQAVSETARDRAQKYGESMKDAREWIEVPAGTFCNAILQKSYKLIESTDEYTGGR